jgi:hypothetical protein
VLVSTLEYREKSSMAGDINGEAFKEPFISTEIDPIVPEFF